MYRLASSEVEAIHRIRHGTKDARHANTGAVAAWKAALQGW